MKHLARALTLLVLAACTVEQAPQETGVMLSVVAPASLRSRIAAIRVRVHSGDIDADDATWPERGDETIEVDAWPPEVFIRATDHRRGWYAHVWGLDEDDAPVAFGEAGGEFVVDKTRQWVVTLDVCVDCAPDDPPVDNVDAGSLPSGSDGGTGVAVRDAAAALDASSLRDSGAGAATDRDSGQPRDASGDVQAPSQDTGTPLPTGNTCATTPAFATPDACSKCICGRCPSQVQSCYASNDTAKNATCKSVRDCAQSNQCTGEACYCGSSPTCLFPDGPCMQVIHTASGAEDLLGVQAARDDPESAYYRSNQVGTCQMSNCATECGLSSPPAPAPTTCDPDSCTNMCLFSTHKRYCTPEGTCGCAFDFDGAACL